MFMLSKKSSRTLFLHHILELTRESSSKRAISLRVEGADAEQFSWSYEVLECYWSDKYRNNSKVKRSSAVG
jgi:hypothetical protein